MGFSNQQKIHCDFNYSYVLGFDIMLFVVNSCEVEHSIEYFNHPWQNRLAQTRAWSYNKTTVESSSDKTGHPPVGTRAGCVSWSGGEPQFLRWPIFLLSHCHTLPATRKHTNDSLNKSHLLISNLGVLCSFFFVFVMVCYLFLLL